MSVDFRWFFTLKEGSLEPMLEQLKFYRDPNRPSIYDSLYNCFLYEFAGWDKFDSLKGSEYKPDVELLAFVDETEVCVINTNISIRCLIGGYDEDLDEDIEVDQELDWLAQFVKDLHLMLAPFCTIILLDVDGLSEDHFSELTPADVEENSHYMKLLGIYPGTI